jgi:hypothetical protein
MTNLRDLAANEMSTLFAGELERRDSEWRLAVTALAEKLAEASTADIAAAAEQTRSEGQVEVERLQALVTRLQGELATQKATSARLSAALQTVQRAISFTDPDDPAPGPGGPPGTMHHSADDDPSSDLGDRPERADVAWNRTSAEAAPMASSPAPVSRALKLVGSTNASGAGSPTDLAEYVTQMLDEIERIYWADSGSDLTPAELLDRLTANIRYARDAFSRRSGGAPGSAALLEQHVSTLLETKAETSFGRHLGFAAYDLFHPKNAQLRSEAS